MIKYNFRVAIWVVPFRPLLRGTCWQTSQTGEQDGYHRKRSASIFVQILTECRIALTPATSDFNIEGGTLAGTRVFSKLCVLSHLQRSHDPTCAD